MPTIDDHDPAPPQPVATDRLALLTRAAAEARRYAAPQRETVLKACTDAVGTIDPKQRRPRSRELERYAVKSDGRSAGGGVRLGEQTSQTAELLKVRAALELELSTERDQRSQASRALEAEQAEHRQAQEALALQQRKLREMQQERSSLLSNVSELESRLRKQINETEQLELKLDKLKNSRQSMSDQATEQAELINQLREQNEKLKVQLEQALKVRDHEVAEAHEQRAAAEQSTAETWMKELWALLHKQVPELFIDTHVPTHKTFEHLAESYVEFLSAAETMERHVLQVLKDLRQVGQQNDKLNHFYIMFTKNPGLLDALREFLTTGKRKNNFANLLRAQQTWGRAFATGLYKVIVRSPVVIGQELSPKDWPIKTGFTVSEEAAIGKYFKETASKQVPEKLGTMFRKQAADMIYEDYDDLMKRR